MSVKSDLRQLRRELLGDADGRCPGCGYRATDIRTIAVAEVVVDRDSGPVRPLVEVIADNPDQPGRERCRMCGGWAHLEFVDAREPDTVEA